MSPQRSKAQNKRRKGLITSFAIVMVLAFGSMTATILAKWHPTLGLDLAGGFSVIYQPVAQHNQQIHTSTLSEEVTILSNRVNAEGVSGATVGTQGHDIVVSVPGVKDAHTVIKRIGSTGQMYFRPTLCYAPAYSKTSNAKLLKTKKKKSLKLPTSCGSKYQLVTSNLTPTTSSGSKGVSYSGISATPTLAGYPSTTPTNDTKDKTVLLPGINGRTGGRYLLGPAKLEGTIVKSALARVTTIGKWTVTMSLTTKGLTGWNTLAKTYFHEIIGIELDGVVQSAPLTLPTASTFTTFSNVQISGTFSQHDAQTLAIALNFGALPIKLHAQTIETVSPTYGRSSLVAGLGAGIAGLLLVLIYTIIYYRLLGLVVLGGLAVTAALLWSMISLLGHTALAPTFSLAGVTGIIVSIGITVDSYIVYFERLKDETRTGRTVRTSVDRAFRGAWRTVVAADLVSLAAAVVLFLVAIGTVKGFAFFLGLSTLLDIFMTYLFTRPLVITLGYRDTLGGGKRFGMARGLAVGMDDAT